jgi:hypothetical protein
MYAQNFMSLWLPLMWHGHKLGNLGWIPTMEVPKLWAYFVKHFSKTCPNHVHFYHDYCALIICLHVSPFLADIYILFGLLNWNARRITILHNKHSIFSYPFYTFPTFRYVYLNTFVFLNLIPHICHWNYNCIQ